MPLNERLLRLSVLRQGERVLVKKVRPLIELDFNTKKDMFLREFDQHPVSQEISEGPNAFSNISSLASAGGNLFSFLGFSSSQNPIAALRLYFFNSIRLGRTKAGQLKGSKVEFVTPVNFPTISEVDAEVARNKNTKLEWTSRPFTSLLAGGIPGLPRYLFNESKRFPSSRSGPAVQTKGDLRSGDTPKIAYVPELLGYLKRIISSKR